MHRIAAILIGCCASFGAAAPASASPAQASHVWYVDHDTVGFGSGTAAQPWVSLTFAVNRPEVASGDTILVAPGDYLYETVVLGGKSLIIRSESGPLETRIYAPDEAIMGSPAPVFQIGGGEQGVIIDGFQISGGSGSLPCDSFQSAVGGGVAICGGSTVEIVNCLFTGNHAELGGALHSSSSHVTVRSTTFRGPGSDAFGEAVFLANSTAAFIDCDFEDLRVAPLGIPLGKGAFVADQSTVTIDRCRFQRNATRLFGGHLWSRGSDVTITRSEFGEVTGYAGAAIAALGGQMTIKSSIIKDARALSAPGAGLFASSATVDLERCLFERNRATGDREGGAIALQSSSLTALNCAFRFNRANNGGAIDVSGDSSAALEGCRLIENIANYEGGGISADAGGYITALRTEFIGNSSANNSRGAALFGRGLLQNCTLHRNIGAAGGAVFGVVTVDASILWRNTPFDVESSGLVSNSIVGSAAGELFFQNVSVVDPLLYGPNDMHLLPGSPAIDALDSGYGLDPDGSPVDIGAIVYATDSCRAPDCQNVGAVGCVSLPNSTGSVATLEALGSDVMSTNRLVLSAGSLPPLVSALVIGSQTYGVTPLPSSRAPLCLAGNLVRVGMDSVATRTDGTLGFRVPLAIEPVSFAFSVGETWAFQVWFRDQHKDTNSNTSNSVVVTLH